MLGSSSHDSGSSSRACSHGGWDGFQSRETILWMSNYNTPNKRWCDFFKWTNVEEEEEAIVGRNKIPVSEDH
ncbi:uncharacterized protein DS421_19g659210 [Arachis hypogaea]|uniref:Uncharacterized protein n=1 Tax=Arachis hypogaea TaxID=3818 RepID=A0A6B9VB42_ARAHY|nr:uncharacterized protein DS421_19g659210 [Arachis hypogaea]